MNKILAIIALPALLSCAGCSTSAPSSVERYLFTTETNFTAHVSQIVTTNNAGIVSVAIQTNILPTVTQTPSPALKSWAGLASGVAETVSPGSGSLVGMALLGIAGFFGLNRQRKLTQAVRGAEQTEKEFFTAQAIAENFAQSIEVLREILKQTPQGQALDVKIVEMLHRNQVSVGLIREAVAIVENSVSNEAAKNAASKILSLLPNSQVKT